VRILTPAFLTLLMLIIIGALVFFYVLKTFVWVETAEAPQEPPRLVPMAASDIPAGTLITEDHVVTGRLDRSKLERDTVLNEDALIGRYTQVPIEKASQFKLDQLYPPNERPPLDLAHGMRALTIGLGESTDVVDGLIKPGDYVDVHLSIDNTGDDRYRGGFTMTMFKGVRVMALNRRTQAANLSRGSNTVTFALTPEQSNILLEAQRHGDIVITYTPNGPGSGGVDVAASDRAYFDEILGLPERPEPPEPFLTELWLRGSKSHIGYGDEYDDYDNNWSDSPWIEQPGWAPPRTDGFGRGGYGGGYGGWGGNRGYRGYRGTQNTPPADIEPQERSGRPNMRQRPPTMPVRLPAPNSAA